MEETDKMQSAAQMTEIRKTAEESADISGLLL